MANAAVSDGNINFMGAKVFECISPGFKLFAWLICRPSNDMCIFRIHGSGMIAYAHNIFEYVDTI